MKSDLLLAQRAAGLLQSVPLPPVHRRLALPQVPPRQVGCAVWDGRSAAGV